MPKRALSLAAFAAALVVWPSCGGDPEEAEKAKVFQYVRGELNGTWKGTTPANEIVTLTFAIADDATQIVFDKCAARGAGIVQAAWACIDQYELPIAAKIDSANGTYRGDLSGKATSLGVASGVNLNLTGATTVYASAKGPDMSANVGTSSATPIDFERN